MLSNNATYILNLLKNDEDGFLPVNMDTDLDKMIQIQAIKELFENGLVKLKNCEGSAIELV